ncbi:glucosamine-6-phosphate deaminase [Streptomyces sp. CB01580]|nr:glucosamine-6-phosphate deaminase [Streptomyces sp. CB01580]
MPLNDLDDRLKVFPDRQALGETAAAEIAHRLRLILAEQHHARMIFAAAPSQTETLAALIRQPDIDWNRVTAFHMDEYLDLRPEAPERFGNWLRTALFDRLPFAAVHYIDTTGAETPQASADRYAELLLEDPIDIVCLGIGVNGHLAFNDPPVADFADPQAVKPVSLDQACREQQVADGCFPALADVPATAITVTIPTLMNAAHLFCMVPGALKADAVRATVQEPLTIQWPSTILRTHPSCTIYTDVHAAALLDQGIRTAP